MGPADGHAHGIGGFAGVGEGAVPTALEQVRIGLLIADQVIPAVEHDSAVGDHPRMEVPRWRMGIGPHLAAARVEDVQTAHDRLTLILVVLRIQVGPVALRSCRCKQDAPIRQIAGLHVGILGLVRYLANHRGVSGTEPADLIQLPAPVMYLEAPRAAHDHAEHQPLPIPMRLRVAHGNAAEIALGILCLGITRLAG